MTWKKQETTPKTQTLFDERVKEYNKIKGPREGDWVKHLDGKYTRITYIWHFDNEPNHIQTGGYYGGQFHLNWRHISYSGGLDPGIPETTLKLTRETKEGRVWLFKDGFWGAGRGVDFDMDFRVYEEVKTT